MTSALRSRRLDPELIVVKFFPHGLPEGVVDLSLRNVQEAQTHMPKNEEQVRNS